MMTTAAGRRRQSNDQPEYRRTAGAGGKYCLSSSDTEGSADKSAEWIGEETEESALVEYPTTVMGARAARQQLTATAGGSAERGADGKHEGATAGGGGGRRPSSGEKRVADRREKRAGKPYGVGGEGEVREA